MSRNRVHRGDAIQSEIVRALLAVGCYVVNLSQAGRGVPDLLVGYRRQTFLLEIKARHGLTTPAQKEFHGRWLSFGGPLNVVHSVDEALVAVGAIPKPATR